MTKTDKSYNEELRNTYRSLPVKDYMNVRKELMEELGWAVNTFYARLNGRAKIRGLEVPIIKKVFEKYGYDIFNR